MQLRYDIDNIMSQDAKCKVTQFSESLMDAREILQWMWQPREQSPVNYMGAQCLSLEQQNVLGFKGIDTEGIPWQTFFDAKTKQPIKGFSGEGNPESESGSTII